MYSLTRLPRHVVGVIASRSPFKDLQKRHLTLRLTKSVELLSDACTPRMPLISQHVASSPTEVEQIARELGGSCIVTSPFSHGIHAVDSVEQAKALAARILQTQENKDPELHIPLQNQLYFCELIPHVGYVHLKMMVDRENYCPVLYVTENLYTPERPCKKHKFLFSLTAGITNLLIEALSNRILLPPSQMRVLEQVIRVLYGIFIQEAESLDLDCLLHDDGTLSMLSPVFSFDPAAIKGRTHLSFSTLSNEQASFAEEADVALSPAEVKASKHGLIYMPLPNGYVGTVVNGAGLAMATCDAIADAGGRAANFLDGGGQATTETMREAFRIVSAQKIESRKSGRVGSILVNVYGGITRGDMIAESIIATVDELRRLDIPLVVRLQGTNSAQGLKMLREANLGIHVEADFGRAAAKAVELADLSS